MIIGEPRESPEVDSPSFGELQSAVANQQAGVASNLLSTGGVLGVASGGTGSTSASSARSALGAAPNSATFVTTAAETELSAESVLTGTANQITVTAATISIPATLSITTAYQVSGTQVVKARKTGWGSPAGTLSRAAYTAYAGQTVSNPPTQGEMQALDDAVKLLSQTVAALLTDLHGSTSGHGVIGA